MANKITNTDNYTAIANAIRAKNGSSDTYTPSQMATAISNIPTGTSLPANTKFGYTKPSIINQIFYTDEYDTSAYTDMSHMFDSCFAEPEDGVYTLQLSKLDTSNVTNMDSIFKGNTYLSDWSSVGLTNFDTSNVIFMGGMFQGCKQANIDIQSAEVIDLSSFDFSNVTHTTYMFKDAIAGGITWPSNINTSSLIGAYQMFYGFLTENLDLSDFDFSSLEYADQMFATSQMTSLTMNGCDFTSMSSGHAEFKKFFYNSRIPTITLRNWKLKDGAILGGSNIADGMFSGCSSTTTIDMSGWTIGSSIASTQYMFYKCTSLQTLDISGIDLPNITTFTNMFGGTSSSSRVPYGCLIYVKDQDSKDWMTSHFSSYTNVQIKS